MKDCTRLIKNPQFYLIDFPQKTDKVYFDVFYKSGHIFDPHEVMGSAHILEHYIVGLMKSRRTDGSFKVNGGVSNELFGIYSMFKRAKMIEGLDSFLSGIYKIDFLNNEIFRSETKSIRNEMIEKNHDNKNKLVDLVYRNLFIGNCPYGITDTDRDRGLKMISLPKINRYYEDVFMKSEPIFFIGGYKLDKKELKNIVKKVREYIPKEKALVNIASLPECKLPLFRVEELRFGDIDKGAYSVLIFPGLSAQNDDLLHRLSLNILLGIVAGSSSFGFSSKLREKGIYAVDQINNVWQNSGIVGLAFFSDDIRNLSDPIKIIKDHIDQIKDVLVDEDFLDDILTESKKNQKDVWKDNDRKYNWIVGDLKRSLPMIDSKIFDKTLKKITPEFLRSITNIIFDWGKLNLFLVHNGKKKIDLPSVKRVFSEK